MMDQDIARKLETAADAIRMIRTGDTRPAGPPRAAAARAAARVDW